LKKSCVMNKIVARGFVLLHSLMETQQARRFHQRLETRTIKKRTRGKITRFHLTTKQNEKKENEQKRKQKKQQTNDEIAEADTNGIVNPKSTDSSSCQEKDNVEDDEEALECCTR
jgi:hypothetical protein